MPAGWCEPLSMLQRFSEITCYIDLLHKASVEPDPCKRLEYISAFAVSNISPSHQRFSKQFNPLLGETYEFVR